MLRLDPISIASVLESCGCADVLPEGDEFRHSPTGSVLFGPGVVAQVGERIAALGVKRVLVVTDPGIARAGHLEKVVGYLEAAGLDVTSFTDVQENPDTNCVDHCTNIAKESGAEAIIGLGGGSSMDTAKGCNFILTNGGKMQDYWGVGKATQPMLPFIAIPTTSGTGSECQSFALISDAITHAKMACGDKKAAATLAILDPELTVTQPALVTRHTGIDALTHALESAVSTKASEVSQAYSLAAFALLAKGFPIVLKEPQNLAARAQMLLGAALAGVAIENSMLGAAHACANPLTANYDIVHGEAVGAMMAGVIELNLSNSDAASMYEQLANRIGLKARELPEWFRKILGMAGMPQDPAQLSIPPDDVPMLAGQAAKQWTGTFNPVKVGESELANLYQVGSQASIG